MKTLSPRTTIGVYFIGVIGTFLIMFGLIGIMYYYTRPPGVDQARAAERRKNLADLTALTKEQLENYGWIDQKKGVVRVPVTRGMELSVQEWQAGLFHSNLFLLFQKSTNVPPPPNYE